MAENIRSKLTRRDIVKTGAALAAAPVVRAGGAAAQDVADIPRERTLVLRWGSPAGTYIDHELWNGYALGASHQNGLGLFYEPLAFYSAFADETIPWLAESWSYNEDSTVLTITTRSGITWSDGTPFTAEDVAFTINTVKEYGVEVQRGANVAPFVQEAVAETENNVLVRFAVPAPRFMYFMTYKFDIGLYIVPKHIYEGQDWTTFQAYDLEQGWPVTTGPWRLALSTPEQKIIDRADSWWAVDQGLVGALPAVERIVYLPFTAEEQVAQQLITNEIDSSLALGALTIQTVVEQNSSVITHSGRELPYGYVDWWPTSLYVNCEREPYSDPNVRWALSYFLDRQQIIDVGLGGAGTTYPLPLPSYPGLTPFVDSVADLLEQYPTLEFNPDKGAELLTASGWTKEDDRWTKDGRVLEVPIDGSVLFSDIGPVMAEQLRRQGVEATYTQPVDVYDRFAQGDYNTTLFGHGGSVSGDPYFTLQLYQSESVAVPGVTQENFSRWHNDEYDAIVDEMAVTPLDDQAALMEQFRRAMELWLPALPDIQIQEFYHRLPMNQTYWTGWPTAEDPYVNGAFWHLTFQLILNRLQAVQ